MDINAITDQGKAVILKSDGTWEFAQSFLTSSAGTFRKAQWGMTKEQVRALEGVATIHESEDVIIYSGVIGGLQCHIIYIFALDRLVRAKYTIVEQHSSANKYFVDFEKLSSALATKYGKGEDDGIQWLDNTYRNDPNDWGLAVGMGHCSRFVQWSYQDTLITLYITGDNYEVQLGVEYGSQKLGHLEEQKNANQLFDDL